MGTICSGRDLTGKVMETQMSEEARSNNELPSTDCWHQVASESSPFGDGWRQGGLMGFTLKHDVIGTIGTSCSLAIIKDYSTKRLREIPMADVVVTRNRPE